MFITWAHKNPGWNPTETAAWLDSVRSFATVLRSHGGIDADIDLWHLSQTVDWSRWGPNRISECERVIVVLSTAWAERFEGRGDPAIGAGAAAEADELLGIYNTNRAHFHQKVLLVLLPDVPPGTIPNRLHGVNRFTVEDISIAGIEELLRYLTGQPEHLRPALGSVPELPPADPGTPMMYTGTASVGAGSDDASTYDTVPRSDYAARLRAASDTRLRQRRRGVGLDDDAVEFTLDHQPAVPSSLTDLRSGHLRLLTGPLGSGKSDIAEQWHRTTIDSFDRAPGSQIPVWLSMRDLDASLERAVIREIGRHHLHMIGADIVLDGLDERTDLAADAVRQASIFVARWPRARVVLTSRATWSVSEKDVVPVEPLPLRTGLAVARAAAGGRTISAADIDEALLQRPLFALLAGQHAYSPEGAAGVAELIDAVVSRVVASDSHNLYDELKRLAVENIRGGGPIDPAIFTTEPIADGIRKSPLTTAFGRRCVFSLATFEQWFASKALLEGDVDLDDLLVSLASFDRWKYVFANVLAAGQPERVDPIMCVLAEWNPGAASWVIRETRNSGLTRRRPILNPGEWQQIGARVRIATAAWLTGLQPMHLALAPISFGAAERFDETSTLISIEPNRLLIGWLGAYERPNHPLPSVIDDIPCDSDGNPTHSLSCRSSELPTGVNWVWERTQSDLAADIGRHLKLFVEFIGRKPGGIVAAEATEEARVRSTTPPMFGGPPPETQPEPLYPGPDRPATHLTPWGSYSTPRMRQRVECILASAMQCYLELADALTPRFGTTLAHRGLMPFEFYCDLSYDDTTDDDYGFDWNHGEPGLLWLLKPRNTVDRRFREHENTVALTVDDDVRAHEISDERDALYEQFRRYLRHNPAYEPFAGSFSTHSSRLRVLDGKPATRIAASWLAEDLERLGFLPKNFSTSTW